MAATAVSNGLFVEKELSMSGQSIRMGRFLGPDRNVALVAIDHGAEFGPLPGLTSVPETLGKLSGADGILLNPGMMGACGDFFAAPDAPAMIVRLTWTSSYCFPWNYTEAHTCRVAGAGAAMIDGADVVMIGMSGLASVFLLLYQGSLCASRLLSS